MPSFNVAKNYASFKGAVINISKLCFILLVTATEVTNGISLRGQTFMYVKTKARM